MCHLIPLLPVLGLGVFLVFPLEVALPLYGSVVAGSALLGFAVWGAFRLPIQTGAEGMIGKEARVVQALDPSAEPIGKGEKVIILAVKGLVATVRRG